MAITGLCGSYVVRTFELYPPVMLSPISCTTPIEPGISFVLPVQYRYETKKRPWDVPVSYDTYTDRRKDVGFVLSSARQKQASLLVENTRKLGPTPFGALRAFAERRARPFPYACRGSRSAVRPGRRESRGWGGRKGGGEGGGKGESSAGPARAACKCAKMQAE